MFYTWQIDDPESRMPPPRLFPAPWLIEEKDACFVVRDRGGQALGYFYFEEEPGRRLAAKMLTKDEDCSQCSEAVRAFSK